MSTTKIDKLHHAAYRCRDAEETRKFYEDFIGLPLVNAFEIHETKTGRTTDTIHVFFQMADGTHVAFFETNDHSFEFKEQHDYDLHLALEVSYPHLEAMLQKGKDAGMTVRGIADHKVMHSIYFRDPNGYVLELTARVDGHDEGMNPETNGARDNLAKWMARKNS